MSSSQMSVESRLGRFINGNAIVQSSAAYAPTSPPITKAALSAFIPAVETKNLAVTLTRGEMITKKNDRKRLTLFDKELQNTPCWENRLVQIVSYLRSLPFTYETSYLQARTILRLVKPGMQKPRKGEEKVKHRLSRSHAAIRGLATELLAILTTLPPGVYVPSDPLCSVISLQNLNTAIETANNEVNIAEGNYKNAVIARRGAYQDLNKRIAMIKNYLRSFPDGKKSDLFIEFKRAVGG